MAYTYEDLIEDLGGLSPVQLKQEVMIHLEQTEEKFPVWAICDFGEHKTTEANIALAQIFLTT